MMTDSNSLAVDSLAESSGTTSTYTRTLKETARFSLRTAGNRLKGENWILLFEIPSNGYPQNFSFGFRANFWNIHESMKQELKKVKFHDRLIHSWNPPNGCLPVFERLLRTSRACLRARGCATSSFPNQKWVTKTRLTKHRPFHNWTLFSATTIAKHKRLNNNIQQYTTMNPE